MTALGHHVLSAWAKDRLKPQRRQCGVSDQVAPALSLLQLSAGTLSGMDFLLFFFKSDCVSNTPGEFFLT